MENRQQQHGVSVSGFLLGVLVGVLVTLLFTTKKGKLLVKTLTEEGLDKVSLLEDLLNEKDDEDIIEGEQAEAAEEKTSEPKETNGHTKSSSTIGKVKSSTRRFFKRSTHN